MEYHKKKIKFKNQITFLSKSLPNPIKKRQYRRRTPSKTQRKRCRKRKKTQRIHRQQRHRITIESLKHRKHIKKNIKHRPMFSPSKILQQQQKSRYNRMPPKPRRRSR